MMALGNGQSHSVRVAVAYHPPLARIVLQNPPLNVIDLKMMDELTEMLAAIESRSDVSVIVISGDGKAFSAGVDVAAHTPELVPSMLSKFHGIIRALVASRKVTIATVHGPCLGGGAELAMVCDMVFTSDSAQWGFPEIGLGCYPPVACAALASLVGQKRAMELILTGRAINGAEAAVIGLATRCVPEQTLKTAVVACVEDLLRLSAAALALAKKACSAWDAMHFEKRLDRAEEIYLHELMQTQDAQEGIRAFTEKRKPEWTGQ